MSRVNLDALLESTLDATVKGLPPGVTPLRLSEVGRQGWNILRGDLPPPVAVLKQSALVHNRRWMRRFLARTGTQLCPHGKTTMAPQLFAQQLEDGAWGITLATPHQVSVARRFGVERILLANQLVAPVAIDYIVDDLARHPTFEFLCLVDSPAGVDRLADGVRRRTSGRPIDVLVEVGVAGKRTGCRSVDEALAVARQVQQATPYLRLRGVEGFEGVITGDTPDERRARVSQFLRQIVEVARRCRDEDLVATDRLIVTAGGSSFFDLVAAGFTTAELGPKVDILIRSGCYLTHDSAVLNRLYEELLQRSPSARDLGPGLRPALEVWSQVQSRPEATRAILTMGKRDVSFDADLPVPILWHRPGTVPAPQPLGADHRIVGLNDQHAMLDLPASSPLAVGDLIACGISHPCTTFDRWQFLAVVDDEYRVVEGIRTFF